MDPLRTSQRLHPKDLRTALASKGVQVSRQTASRYLKLGAGCLPGSVLAAVAEVCGLTSTEAAELDAAQGTPLPSSVLHAITQAEQLAGLELPDLGTVPRDLRDLVRALHLIQGRDPMGGA